MRKRFNCRRASRGLYGALLVLMTCLLPGCASHSKEEPRSRVVFAMDTVMTLTEYGQDETVLDEAERELYRLDALLARGTQGSAVYVFNHGGEPDAELSELLALSEEISAATGGSFDPYLGAVLDLWGFGSGAGEHRVPTAEELANAPRLLDLGGIAKGYAGQRMLELLSGSGVTSAVVDLGGDVALLGRKPDGSNWRVAVKDPGDPGAFLGVLETAGGVYVATSGVYERFFEENGTVYHHILDPKTDYPAGSGVVSATVICESGVWADALATAVCVLGAEDALALRERLADRITFDLILVTGNGQVRYTSAGFAPGTGNGYHYEQVA